MARIFLEDLVSTKNKISWKKSIGRDVRFEYKGIFGTIKLHSIEDRVLTVVYSGISHKIGVSEFKECKIGRILGLINNLHKYEVGETINGLIIVNQTETKCSKGWRRKSYLVKCPTDNYEYELEESELVKGVKCTVCSGRTVLKEYNSVWKKRPDLVKYFKNIGDSYKYTEKSNKKIRVRCDECEKEKTVTVDNLSQNGICCAFCGDGFSYPEKLVSQILNESGIKFESQKMFEWCKYFIDGKTKRCIYDFYSEINGEKILIEVDGGFHYFETTISKLSLKEIREIDEIKDKLAKDNGKKLIRIDCRYSDFDFIKNNIINSDLKNYINFNEIDWEKCEVYANRNKIKEATLMWEKGERELSSIAKHLRVSEKTTKEYLKKAKELGWVVYDSKDLKKNKRKYNYKKVKCIETEEVFDSVNQCAERLTKEKGVTFLKGGIVNCCTGHRENYKEFTFEYI